MNDLTRTAIFDACNLILDYIDPDDLMEENEFCEMLHKFNRYKFCMPEEVAKIFEDFITEKLEPYIYGDAVLYDMKKIAPQHKAGGELSEEQFKKVLMECYSATMDIRRDFEENVVNAKLKQYLLSD